MRINAIPFANDTVTVYNGVRSVGGGRTGLSWHRRVIDGCRWGVEVYFNEKGGATAPGAKVLIDIPSDTDFVSRGEWDALEDKTGKFTLAAGDIAVLGIAEDEISGAVTPDALLAKYRLSGAVIINSVTERAGAGVPLGHYRVCGNRGWEGRHWR